MSSREHSPRGIVRQYSKGCDQKCSKAKSVLRLPRSVEYCSFVNFRKEGNGIIQYFDDLNREVYVILGNWKKGNLCGKAILYNILEDCIESILYFNNGDFVDESPLSLEETDLYIIDKPDGYRWEVPIQNGMMAGRGTEYDEENKKVFAGWYYDNTRFGKGERFYSINEELQSRGFWHSGKEYGPMELFDLKGDYIGEVIMIHGEEVSQTCILHNPTQIEFSSFTESITIEGFEGPSVSIVDLSSCHHLKEIKIGDKCFLEARSFLLIDNPSIERIAIGTFAFYSHQGVDPYPLPYEDKRRILSNRKIASIRHCPKLRVLDIGNESFTDFISLELVQLPCLEVCHIGQPSPRSGEWGLNFYWCKNLNLQQLPALQSVRFGNYAFFYCYHLQIDSCPLLKSLHVGYGGFSNYEGKEASFFLSNLPSLEHILIENEAFYNCTTLNLKKLQGLVTASQVTLGPQSFYYLKKIRVAEITEEVFSVFYQTRNYHPSVIKTSSSV